MTAKKHRILVVDDHPDVRMGLGEMIQLTRDLGVCGEAQTAEEAMAKAVTLQPELAIVDISLKGSIDGIELTRRLQAQCPALRVLVLSLHEEQGHSANALAAGAHGYVSKTATAHELLRAIRNVLHAEPTTGKPADNHRRREDLNPAR